MLFFVNVIISSTFAILSHNSWILRHDLLLFCGYEAWLCRDGVRNTKAMLDLTLARDTKNNEKSFLGLSEKEGQRRWTPLLNNAGKLVTMGKGKSEVLSCSFLFFVSFFNGTLSSYTSWVAGQQDGSWGSKVFAIISEPQAHDHLRNLNVQKSVGPSEMQWEPWGSWEVTDVVVKHSPWLLKGHGAQMKLRVTGKSETLYPSLKIVERKTLGTINLVASPHYLGRSWNRSS